MAQQVKEVRGAEEALVLPLQENHKKKSSFPKSSGMITQV